MIAEIRKDYIYNKLLKGERVDDRGFDEFRPIDIETNVVDKAEGSAMVHLGDTTVLVGVKIQPGDPFSDTPDKGVIITNVELVPLASPNFEPGPPREDATEIARVVDRGVRESGALDLSSLCIVEGEKVWMIFIDIHVLDHDGNIMDAASMGAAAALLTATIPGERHGVGEDEPVPMRDIPIGVTAIEVGDEILLDPNLDEEYVAGSKLTVITNQDGSISGMQKAGSGTLTVEQAEKIVDMAIEKAGQIREQFIEV